MGYLSSPEDEFAVAAGAPRLALTSPPTGVVLGRDQRGRLLRAHLVDEEPVSTTVLAGTGLVALLLRRVVASGTRVVVRSTRPELWSTLRGRLGARVDDVEVLTGAQAHPGTGSFARPVLVVTDLGHAPATPPPATPPPAVLPTAVLPTAPAPWVGSLTVAAGFTPAAAPVLRESALLLCGAMPVAEATFLLRVLGWAPATAAALTGLRPDQLAVLSTGRFSVATAVTDRAEAALREEADLAGW